MVISSADELARAMKRGESTIQITFDLSRLIIRVQATGDLAWGVAIMSIAAVVFLIIVEGVIAAPTLGLSSFVDVPVIATAGTTALTILGLPATYFAVRLAITAGGTAILNNLRKRYTLRETQGQYYLIRIS